MTQYRYDNLSFSTVLPNYIDIGNTSGSIPISGSVADASTATFSTTIQLSADHTFSDIYAFNAAVSGKVQLVSPNSISFVYSSVSFEVIRVSIVYSGNQVTVTIAIDNDTGAPISLTSQTFTIEVVQYMLPI